MKLKKLGITALAIALVAGHGAANIASAQEVVEPVSIQLEGPIITPYWSHVTSVTVLISKNGTTLYPEAYVNAISSSSYISGSMHLEKYSGGSWVIVKTWGISGTGTAFASQTYTGMPGVTYRTRVAVSVNGEYIEATSVTTQP